MAIKRKPIGNGPSGGNNSTRNSPHNFFPIVTKRGMARGDRLGKISVLLGKMRVLFAGLAIDTLCLAGRDARAECIYVPIQENVEYSTQGNATLRTLSATRSSHSAVADVLEVAFPLIQQKSARFRVRLRQIPRPKRRDGRFGRLP